MLWSDRRAALPSLGHPVLHGQLSKGGLDLHLQKVLCQGLLLPALLVSAQLLQLLEEAWEGPEWWLEPRAQQEGPLGSGRSLGDPEPHILSREEPKADSGEE